MDTSPSPAGQPKPQCIELLTGIYSLGAAAYRLNETCALVQIGKCVFVERPWQWTGTPPTTPDYWGQVPDKVLDYTRCYMSLAPSAVATIPFAVLLLWCSRRRVLEDNTLDWDVTNSIPMDAQQVGLALFNRVLIREVLQTWIEASADPHGLVLLERFEVRDRGPALRLSCSQIRAIVMGLGKARCGTDPLPVDWKICSVGTGAANA